MAGDWIKMRTALAHDPAVIAVALDLDKSEFEVVGMLHHIWSWADSQSQDGHIKRVTEKWLDRFVHCDGFSKALASAKWLIIRSDGIEFPNFGKHNGESAKKRAEAAERQRLSRELKAAADVELLSQGSRDESVTREEKEKEKEKEKIKAKPEQDQKTTAAPRRDWLAELIEHGVNEKHAKDWLEVRRGKKAKMTDTVVDGIKREARIANVSFGEAIRISAESGWQGFKADWLSKPAANSGGRFPTKSEAIQAANQLVLDQVIQEDNERRRALGEIIDDAPLLDGGDLLTIEGSFFRAD